MLEFGAGSKPLTVWCALPHRQQQLQYFAMPLLKSPGALAKYACALRRKFVRQPTVCVATGRSARRASTCKENGDLPALVVETGLDSGWLEND